MLDVIKSLDRLTWNTQHHFTHIEAQHDFIRAWAIQFELGYTDVRVVQMALQLDGKHHDLLQKFTAAYEKYTIMNMRSLPAAWKALTKSMAIN